MLHGPLSFQGFARTPLHNYHLCIFATFSLKLHLLGLGTQHILNPQRQQFGNAGARVVEQHEEQMIPPSRPRVCRRRQERFNLRTREEADQRLDLPLKREGQNASRGRRQLRPEPIRQVVHERAQRRQASVTGADGVAPALLQMIEKAQDGVGRQAFQGERGQSLPPLLAPVLEQEPEGIAVSGHGGGADIALPHQVFLEITLDPFGEVRAFHEHRFQNVFRLPP